jgi:hypothetical protein
VWGDRPKRPHLIVTSAATLPPLAERLESEPFRHKTGPGEPAKEPNQAGNPAEMTGPDTPGIRPVLGSALGWPSVIPTSTFTGNAVRIPTPPPRLGQGQ